MLVVLLLYAVIVERRIKDRAYPVLDVFRVRAFGSYFRVRSSYK